MTLIHVTDENTGQLVEIDIENPTGTLYVIDADTGDLVPIDLSSPTETLTVLDANTGDFVDIDYSNPVAVFNVNDPNTGEIIEIDLSNPTGTLFCLDENTGDFVEVDLSTAKFIFAGGAAVPLVTGDTEAPTVTITSTETSPSAVLPVPITITLSEVSMDFAEADLTLSGCTVASFAGSGTSYTCTATPTAPNGTFTIDIAENAFHDAAGNGNTAATQFSFTSSAFVLADEFTDTVAAGAVNGTNATPTGGARTVVDGNSKLSIGLGVAGFATGGVTGGNPGLWYAGMARAAGKVLIAKLSGTYNNHAVGWDTNQTFTPIWALNFNNGTDLRLFSYSGSAPVIGAAPAQNVPVYCAIVQRAAGMFVFIKETTAYPNWTLLYTDKGGTEATIYPAAGAGGGTAAVFSLDYMRVPASTVTIAPLASDNFTAADGALGNTRGGGAAEAGGDGLAWASQLGTWGIATNKAASSALDGGSSISIATVNAGAADVFAEVVFTRSAGTAGLCLRYTDANNYIKCVHNGTNMQVIEVVAGTPNTIINTAATYGATKTTRVSLSGAGVRVYYDETLVNTATTAITTGNNHGLFTDNTGATFDNFVIWRKAGGAYDTALNPFLA